jgi:ABC-2 type transport system ATP-binding protein
MRQSTSLPVPAPDGTAPVVELRGLSKRYGDLIALDDVTLDIRAGEIFGLLGPNGAGKSTLIGCIAGLVVPSAGSASVLGWDVQRSYDKTRQVVGLVPQEINFDPFFTVEETLRFQAGYFGVRLEEERLDELLVALDLMDKRDAGTRSLSGGMKRRLLIGKALVHDPKVLFLDEPTAGVDVELRRDLWAYVETLRERGTTVVLTTHYLAEAEALSDRIGLINHGKLLLVEKTSALLSRLGQKSLSLHLGERVDRLPASLEREGATIVDDGWKVRVSGPSDTEFGRLVCIAQEAGLSIRDLETTQTSLEQIYVELLEQG